MVYYAVRGSTAAQGALYHPAFGEVLRYRVDRVSDDPETQTAR